MRFIDLSGKRFGRLVVLKRAGTYISPKGAKSVLWLCKCDCGKTITVVRTSLKSGCTTSCGCARSETHFNNHYIDGDTVHIICNNGEILIDEKDLPVVNHDRWHIGKNGYGYRDRDKQLLHRILLDVGSNEIVDHINHNKSDNRRCNLRIADYSINGINKKLKPGLSGEPYIAINSKSGYYNVNVDGKYRGGSYSLDEAIKIRNKALVGSKAEKYNPEVKRLLGSID